MVSGPALGLIVMPLAALAGDRVSVLPSLLSDMVAGLETSRFFTAMGAPSTIAL